MPATVTSAPSATLSAAGSSQAVRQARASSTPPTSSGIASRRCAAKVAAKAAPVNLASSHAPRTGPRA